MTDLKAQVIIVSDRGASGEREDLTFPLIRDFLAANGWAIQDSPIIVPDDRQILVETLRRVAADGGLVLTSGGTGIGSRDVTPDATLDVVEKVVPGLAEAMRATSRTGVPTADLSRAIAGVLGRTLVVNLPGSPRGAIECLESIASALPHAVKILYEEVADCQDELAKSEDGDMA